MDSLLGLASFGFPAILVIAGLVLFVLPFFDTLPNGMVLTKIARYLFLVFGLLLIIIGFIIGINESKLGTEIVLATYTPYPTYTPLSTYTPFPLVENQAIIATQTPYPTYTPNPPLENQAEIVTQTPYPTYTPNPTYTIPAPTPTESPPEFAKVLQGYSFSIARVYAEGDIIFIEFSGEVTGDGGNDWICFQQCAVFDDIGMRYYADTLIVFNTTYESGREFINFSGHVPFQFTLTFRGFPQGMDKFLKMEINGFGNQYVEFNNVPIPYQAPIE